MAAPADAHGGWTALNTPAWLLGEGAVWHGDEQALYGCDIAGHRLWRWTEDAGCTQWELPGEVAACAPAQGGGLVLAMRDGLWQFDPTSGVRRNVASPPYDPARQRFNDAVADADGRWWLTTLDDARTPGAAALWCWDGARLRHIRDGLTVGNGLALAPDGRKLYVADTTSHRIWVHALTAEGALGEAREWAQFPPRARGQLLADYGGRPDGAAVDAAGSYWVAMYEGARLLRLDGAGAVQETLPLPLRCPTKPCLGGADGRTLFVTSARQGRAADELAREPLAGRVLARRVAVAGAPSPAVALR